MRNTWLAVVLIGLVAAATGQAAFWGYDGSRERHLDTVLEGQLGDFTAGTYRATVAALMREFEERTGRVLRPGERRRAGLKVYANSGAGLATPRALVDAVIEELEARGFQRSELFLLDLRETWLRDAGFLPQLSRRGEVGANYRGVPVKVLEDGRHYDPVWYYDNPLPPQSPGFGARERPIGRDEPEAEGEDRRSYLPVALVRDVDFWINLPVVFDHPALGVSGAIANHTIWNVSNHSRFLLSPSNAPIAAVEIAAIPEFAGHLAFHLMTLERYQFIGGPVFTSLYTRSEPRLWLSVNPVVLDAAMLQRINRARIDEGFKAIAAEPQILTFAETIGLGGRSPDAVQWIPVTPR